jgi:anti-sigma factor RsiW
MIDPRIGGMTCREAVTLLPRFFDGELDSRHMRSVALHSTRCAACEAELRQLERIQQALSDTLNATVDTIDFAGFWPAVETRLAPLRIGAWQRVQAWWADGAQRWVLRVPAYAAAAAIGVLALLYATRALQPSAQPDATRVASLDHPAVIDSLESDSDSVTMISDPDTSTAVLWVEAQDGEE